MTAGNPHRIQRQVLELDLVSTPGAAAILQEEAARPFRAHALPMLEKVFDRVVGPERWVRLDRLEVDLGELRGRDWAQQLVERLTHELRASLAALPRSGAGAPRQGPANASEAWFEQLVFFVVHGRLPWWGTRSGPGGSEGRLALVPQQSRALRDLIAGDARAGPRLVESVDDAFLAELVAALAGLPAAGEVAALLAPEPRAPGSSPRAWRRRFWTLVLESVLDGPLASESGRRLMRRLLAEREVLEGGGKSADVTLPIAGSAPAPRPVPPALPSPWREWLEAGPIGAPLRGPATPEPRERDGGPTRSSPGEDGAAAPRSTAGAPTAESTDTPARAAPVPSEGPALTVRRRVEADAAGARGATRRGIVDGDLVFAPGAGIVILHPFLDELFRSRGLLDRSSFRDDAARRRGVHLLGHLTFGGDAPEYDQLLPKLLCGMPWEELLPPGDLDDDDRAACGELLAAVLGHWRALKSGSADWLRQQFFLRDGTLEAVDDGWRLTVERRAQDVLLARLPWGLGLVRLPWLRDVLHVRWTD